MDEKRMQQFAMYFEKEIFPRIVGEDGKGIERLQKVVEQKRSDVEKRKRAKEAYVKKEEGGDC